LIEQGPLTFVGESKAKAKAKATKKNKSIKIDTKFVDINNHKM